MARQRKGKSQETVSDTQTGSSQTERIGIMAVETLNADQIQALLSSSRQRGTYDDALRLFVESDESGVKVDLESGTFSGKKAQSVKTGFESARKREGAPEGAANVRVIVNDDNVYLIRTDQA